MKQTAVEWLEEQINKQQQSYILLTKGSKSLKKGVEAILTATTLLKMKCTQAKEMEKQQITDACYFGSQNLPYEVKDKSEQYYNETFNK